MRATHAIALFTTLILLASCTKESALFTTPTPEIEMAAKRHAPKQTENDEPRTTSLEGETTMQLLVESESFDPNTGIYSITFGADFDFTNTQPSSAQQLDFTGGQGNPTRRTLTVAGYQTYNKAIDIDFTVGIQSMSGLDLSEVQMIVIEELVIN